MFLPQLLVRLLGLIPAPSPLFVAVVLPAYFHLLHAIYNARRARSLSQGRGNKLDAVVLFVALALALAVALPVYYVPATSHFNFLVGAQIEESAALLTLTNFLRYATVGLLASGVLSFARAAGCVLFGGDAERVLAERLFVGGILSWAFSFICFAVNSTI